jgi:hypothetical protein
MEDLGNDGVREQSEKAGLETALEKQRQRNGNLEGERNRQKGTITRQASEIEGFRNAKRKWEDELKRSTEANEAHKEELAQLKDEIKAMKAKEARLGGEVAELTNLLKHTVLHHEEANAGEIIKRIFPESKQFPPSVKKGKTKDWQDREVEMNVPDRIIAYLTRKCGGNVHDRHVAEVSSGSFQKEIHGANPYSGHGIMIHIMWRRMLLIWKLVQLIATRVFLTRGTVGCAMISGRGGLCQRTTQSARMMVFQTGVI